jgi:hypothetical protein
MAHFDKKGVLRFWCTKHNAPLKGRPHLHQISYQLPNRVGPVEGFQGLDSSFMECEADTQAWRDSGLPAQSWMDCTDDWVVETAVEFEQRMIRVAETLGSKPMTNMQLFKSLGMLPSDYEANPARYAGSYMEPIVAVYGTRLVNEALQAYRKGFQRFVEGRRD